MKTATFSETREELRELTGLPSDDHDKALWDAGFDLDDWNFGFVSDTEWSEEYGFPGVSYYEYWLLDRMANWCVGYQHTEYKGRHYYMMYHLRGIKEELKRIADALERGEQE